jgi:hypothetical protein
MKGPMFVAGALVGYALGFSTPTLIRYGSGDNENLPTGSPRDQTEWKQPVLLHESPEPAYQRDRHRPFQLLPTYVDPTQAQLRVHPPVDAMGAHGAILAGGG